MLHAISLGLSCFILWLLLSGHYTPLLLCFGLASCLLVVVVARRMEVVDREGHPVHLGLGLLRYWPWLLKEIITANVQVMRCILKPQLIDPQVIQVRPGQRSDLGRVIYANSITLTPGT
ncbi:MAG: Na+/H+ antiporter subunit E, partial [Candidatus Competibacteraceae bacterium]|nr:Na+/H+ antiporter subunit E [Candidatus Competibacteraceae bacterium]